MSYNLYTVQEEHKKHMNKTHKFYCKECNKFVCGTANDKGVMGYTYNCPIHGELK